MRNVADHTILIIDDDQVVRESIALYLSEKNYRLVLASDATIGIDCFHSSCPDLVVCNINLPASEGFDVIKELFKLAPEQPIIILADSGKTDDVIEAMRLGVSDYLFKPLNEMAMLGLSIKNSLRRAKLKDEHHKYEQKLEIANRELEQSVDIYKQDQQAGRHVQISMLPEPSQDISGYHFDHKVIPSLFLSGDTVDYKPLPNGQVLFYIADVSGHGSSSAFITILLAFRIEQMRREFLRGNYRGEYSPATILASLNKDVLDADLDKHITLFLGLLDQRDSSLTYSVAGHHPLPIVYEKARAEFISVSKSSFPLGIFDEAEYFEEKRLMMKEFSLTLFSDGILEIINAETLEEKENYLLQTVVASQGKFDKIKTGLGLDDGGLSKLPDDIAVLSVNGTKNL